jgi:hypothetical protein
MAAGDIFWFDQGVYRLMRGEIDLDAGSIKLGIITSAATPSKTTADPRWGAGGSTNFSTNQVGTGGTSYTGPISLASPSIVVVTPDIFFRANVVTLAQDASGFTNGRWGILFQDDANDYAVAYVDLGSDRSLVAGQVQIDWNGANNDILKFAN